MIFLVFITRTMTYFVVLFSFSLQPEKTVFSLLQVKVKESNDEMMLSFPHHLPGGS